MMGIVVVNAVLAWFFLPETRGRLTEDAQIQAQNTAPAPIN